MDEFQQEMYEIFAYETNEFLMQLEQLLLKAEEEPAQLISSVNEVFRIMHTIKSSSAMMGLSQMSSLAHRMEDLFQFIRDYPALSVDVVELANMLFQCIDFIKASLVSDTSLGTPEHLMECITQYLARLRQEVWKENSSQLNITFQSDCEALALHAFSLRLRINERKRPVVYQPEENSDNEEAVLKKKGLTLIFSDSDGLDELLAYIKQQPFVTGASIVKGDTTKEEQPEEPVQPETSLLPEEPVQEQPKNKTKEEITFAERRRDPGRRGEGRVGVEVSKLDSLINLTGETIITSMEARHNCMNQNYLELRETLDHLHRLILDIQETTLSLRMVTLGDTFYGLKRAIRDMEKDLQREITFSMSGEDLYMDKDIVQFLHSPLQHLLRNAVEHGIETPEARMAAGKPRAGKICLSASLLGKKVVITVEDDGRGINPEAVISTALKKELITKEQAANLTQEEIYALLLQPGFSTKKEISEYSGRGVGLDTVNDNLRKINGILQIISKPSEGSQFILKVPLTLATLDAFVVTASGERYIVPVNAVSEVFSPAEEDICKIEGQDSVLFKDMCYSVFALDGRKKSIQEYTTGMMILTDIGNWVYALYVDAIIDRRNVVVKPVPELLKQVPGILGCTVLGDGHVCLIIDHVSILQRRGKRNYDEESR